MIFFLATDNTDASSVMDKMRAREVISQGELARAVTEANDLGVPVVQIEVLWPFPTEEDLIITELDASGVHDAMMVDGESYVYSDDMDAYRNQRAGISPAYGFGGLGDDEISASAQALRRN